MQRPTLPDLRKLPEVDLSSDDEGEEERLIAILKKFKSAKSSIDSSKQKKRNREIADENIEQFTRACKTICNRYEDKWSTRIHDVAARHSALVAQCVNSQRELEEEMKEIDSALAGVTRSHDETSNKVKEITVQARQISDRTDQFLDQEYRKTVSELQNRLQDMDTAIIKASQTFKKDDAVSKILYAFISSM